MALKGLPLEFSIVDTGQTSPTFGVEREVRY